MKHIIILLLTSIITSCNSYVTFHTEKGSSSLVEYRTVINEIDQELYKNKLFIGSKQKIENNECIYTYLSEDRKKREILIIKLKSLVESELKKKPNSFKVLELK